LVIAALLIVAIGACNPFGGGGKATQDAAKAQKAAEDKISEIRMQQAKAAPETPADKKADVKVEAAAAPSMEEAVTASYDPINKPDPFRPFKPESVTGPKETDNPLLKYEVRYFKLVGIIRDVENPAAMFEDPAGRAYTLHQGQPIGKNGGVIRAILDDAVVITETRISWRSEGTETVEMTIRLRPDEKKS